MRTDQDTVIEKTGNVAAQRSGFGEPKHGIISWPGRYLERIAGERNPVLGTKLHHCFGQRRFVVLHDVRLWCAHMKLSQFAFTSNKCRQGANAASSLFKIWVTSSATTTSAIRLNKFAMSSCKDTPLP